MLLYNSKAKDTINRKENDMIKEFTDFMKGYVMRDADGSDCTNGGASSKYNRLYVVAEHVTLKDVEEFCKSENERLKGVRVYNVDEFFKPDYDFLHSHNYVRLEPINKGKKWYMAGGNYLQSCDSRFKEFVGGCKYPVPIHDRTESVDMGGN